MDYAKGSLTIPRVNVVWGPSDITELVYDVRVSLDEQGQTPTGSLKWNPSQVGYESYEYFIKNYKDWSIMVTYYYVAGKSITFEFYWGGQSEVYGKEMEITVKLVSFLDGLINANFYASAQTDVGEKGISYSDAVGGLMKQFGLTGNIGPGGRPLDIIRYTPKAWQDMNESIVKFNYNDGATFMEAVQNLVKDNGNNVFFNNIGTANATIFTPYSWEDYQSVESVIPQGWSETQNPDPARRYGYFIGPGIIQSFTRAYEWQPPQKSQEITAMMARKAEERKAAEKAARDAKRGNRGNRNNRNNPDKNAAQSSATATAPSGVYGSKNSGGIRSDKNENGPRKQDIFTKERAAKLSLSTLMCPSLVGLKPLDILFIPNYGGTYIEDWIVSSVEYQQNDKGVELSIQATRWYGEGKAMSEVNSEKYLELATGLGLVGSNLKSDSLEQWVKHAWKEPLKNRLSLASEIPTTTSIPPSDFTEVSETSSGLDTVLNSKQVSPSNIVTPKVNFSGIKLPGMVNPEFYLYEINDYAYGAFLFEEQKRIKSLDGSRLVFVDSFEQGNFFATGKIDSNFFVKNYSIFLTFRGRYLEKLRARFGGDQIQQQGPQLAPASNTNVTQPVTNSIGSSPLKAGENKANVASTAVAPATTTTPTAAAATTGAQGKTPLQNVPAPASTSTQPTTTPATTTPTTTGPQGASSSPQPAPQPVTTGKPTDEIGFLNLRDLSPFLEKTISPSSDVLPITMQNGVSASKVSSVLGADYIELNKQRLGVSVEGTARGLIKGRDFIVKGKSTKEIREILTSPDFNNHVKGLRESYRQRLF
jgi:hypothetical protein